MFNLKGNPIWHLIAASDAMTWFVLLTLLGMSIACWAIFLFKVLILRKKLQQTHHAVSMLNDVKTFEELRAIIASLSATLPGYFLKKNLAFIKSLLENHPERALLTDKEFELLNNNMHQSLDDILYKQESYLPILFSSAAVSPLLGLFGTIWGLVHAFVRISEKQSADIATVAPGIAEALITTLAGLIVAIPSLIMYHYVSGIIKKLEHELFIVSDKFMLIVQRVFVQ
jgi:biopolymer transport protein TolQ